MLTYSFDDTSLVARTFLRLSVCKSYTVMTALSALSATATYFLLAETAKAVIPSVSAVPEMNLWFFCSVW